MPINAGIEFAKANEEYLRASTAEERLKALKLMLSTAPKHKGAEKLRNQLKQRYAGLKKELEKEKKAAKKKKHLAIKKEGAATIAFIGILNSGKSNLFAKLTNSRYESENNYEIRMKMIPLENVWLQGIDLPSFYANFPNSSLAGQVFGLIRSSDVIIIVANDEEQLLFIQSILGKANVKTGIKKTQDFTSTTLPVIVTTSDVEDLQQLKQQIWAKTGKIRIQTKTAGKIAEKPVVLKQGATVKELAGTIHKDFLRNFKYAKIWGKSAKFPGQAIGFEHKLADKDIVEIFTK
jgi:ribosome-interacting GTPase 1